MSSTTPVRSLSPLLAALHHILLWFFTGSSTVSIIGVIASLAGSDVSPRALAAMIAVTLVTFIPYAIFFVLFLRKNRGGESVVPGKVWSIITVCLHSVGAMIVAITLLVNAITDGTSSVLLSAGLILLLDVLVITAYCFAAFTPPSIEKVRRVFLMAYLPLLFIFMGTLSVLALLQIGPAKHDDQLREALVRTVHEVKNYTNEHSALPENDSLKPTDGIIYNKVGVSTYKLCADFQLGRGELKKYSSPNGLGLTTSDDFVYKETFYAAKKGQQCFTFASSTLSADKSKPSSDF